MTAERNFSVDISIKDELGNSAMWHARADTGMDFAAKVAELVAMQPQLRTFVYDRRGIAPSPDGSKDMQPAAVAARAAQLDTSPVCPEHGAASPSKFGGVYCSQGNGDGTFCKWTYSKKARAA